MIELDRLVWTAHADAWQAEGRLRGPLGGGAITLPGIRLMASGLPHAQWNNGDVSDATRIPLDEIRAWYAARAGGTGVPWGVRVPAGMAFGHGQWMFRKRCMGLFPTQFRAAGARAALRIRATTSEDLETVAAIDAEAFDVPIEQNRPWVGPHLGAPGFIVALARLDGAAVGVATAIRTEGLAGSCVGIFGVAVRKQARRRGVGSALTSWLLERAFAEGAWLAHLNPDSEDAQALYARLGFVETAGLDVYARL